MRLIEWPNPANLPKDKPYLSPREFQVFYHVDESEIPEDRPYASYMDVHSADAVIALIDDSSLAYHVVLAHSDHEHAAGSKADHRALHFLWAYSDAVIGGAEILRADPTCTWDVGSYYPDMVQYRQGLGKSVQPIKVILTRRADPDRFNLDWDVFKTDALKIIFTSEAGEESIQNQAEKFNIQGFDPLKTTRIYSLGKDGVEDYREMMRILRQEHGVKLLDVQGGGDVAGQLMKEKLLDEYRYTISPTVFGAYTKDGRARTFPFGKYMSFGKDNSPIFETLGIRLAGNHKLIRERIHYRH